MTLEGVRGVAASPRGLSVVWEPRPSTTLLFGSVRSWAAELRMVAQATQARSRHLRVEAASIIAGSHAATVSASRRAA